LQKQFPIRIDATEKEKSVHAATMRRHIGSSLQYLKQAIRKKMGGVAL